MKRETDFDIIVDWKKRKSMRERRKDNLLLLFEKLNKLGEFKYNRVFDLRCEDIYNPQYLKPFLVKNGYLDINNVLIKPIKPQALLDEYVAFTNTKTFLYNQSRFTKSENKDSEIKGELHKYSDEEIVKELRGRGYTITAIKQL